MEFKKLEEGQISEIEKKRLTSWGGVYNILNETIENRKDSAKFVFYDGPATANPLPVKRYTKLISLNSLLNQGIIG